MIGHNEFESSVLSRKGDEDGFIFTAFHTVVIVHTSRIACVFIEIFDVLFNSKINHSRDGNHANQRACGGFNFSKTFAHCSFLTIG